ncbi:short-chain fatty acid transporter [Romboutsia sedimentorum]|uniref:Short-chain fatty acid transporter n=1 Tax=Romboutsia sedimentorum TaxID=1368474 RepID=A0ABT7E5T8_9FIRM|nr:short-chain fatty acid transporter [Romboutsia sedimentorum]MDK2562288.1 short-chain fatty acid transporter [Romboutsia sedimentorum]MDK2584532.1 short-chain fatty acid transporter [Romboutsia sedimentorum]
MFKKFTNGCVNLVQNYLPDPFLFCIIITIVIFISGIIFTGQGPMDMVVHWSGGFWSLLAFAMQMALVLVLGHTLASAPSFKKVLTRLAKIPKTPTKAILMVTFISSLACLINWGFGLVIGAIFAKELAKEVEGVDYRLLIASAYSGFLLWHAGLSGSIPLTIASGGDVVVSATAGVIGAQGVPTSDTIFSLSNIVIVSVLVLTLPLLNKAMHPASDKVVVIDKKLLIDDNMFVEMPREQMTPADKLENSKIITAIISLMGFSYIIYFFINNGFDLNLDIVNFIFLFLSILLHKTPKRFLHALSGAAKGAGPIMLQFPFYAGIIGMMTGVNAQGVSLAILISNFFVAIANEFTFPMFSFLSAGIVNFFIPSGGGQWAVQAPIMMPAGAALGVDPAKTAMSIAWGDAWTNMIQPFWALPALGIAGLGAKDIMGFCIVDLLYSGVIISLGLMFIGM